MGNVPDRLDVPVTEKETDTGEANGLHFGVSSMQGWRTGMEDSHCLQGSLPGLPDVSFFGIYDGHGGAFTANYIGSNLMRVFMNQKHFRKYASLRPAERDDVPGIKLLKNALTSAFVDMDIELRKVQYAMSNRESVDDMKKEERSGSTCVVVVVTPKHLVCANAGDSRACFQRNGKALPLSFDHKPGNCAELSRIKNAGGTVSLRRVDGDLAVSRGLGDFQYKNRQDLPPEKQKVSCVPDIIIYPRNESQDEFIVLACDGIWDVASNEDCISMIQDILNEGEKNLGLACEEIIDLCLRKDSRDNMSIIIATCPNVRIGEGNGIEGRRATQRINASKGGAQKLTSQSSRMHRKSDLLRQ